MGVPLPPFTVPVYNVDLTKAARWRRGDDVKAIIEQAIENPETLRTNARTFDRKWKTSLFRVNNEGNVVSKEISDWLYLNPKYRERYYEALRKIGICKKKRR